MNDKGMKRELFNELRQIVDDLDGQAAMQGSPTLVTRANEIIDELWEQARGLTLALRGKAQLISELEADLEDLEFTLEHPETELWD